MAAEPRPADKLSELFGSAQAILFVSRTGQALGPLTAKAVELVRSYDPAVRIFDVSRDRVLRHAVMRRSNWDFFPQLYVASEFVGGWAIMPEFFASGEFGRIASSLSQPAAVVPIPPSASAVRLTADQRPRIWRFGYQPESDTLAGASSDGTIQLCNPRTSYEFRAIKVSDGWVNSVALERGGQFAYAALTDGTVGVVDVSNGRQVAKLSRHVRWVNDLVIDRLGKKLWTVSADRQLAEWTLSTNCLGSVRRIHSACVWCIALDKNSDNIATGCADGFVKVWNQEAVELVAEVNIDSTCVSDICGTTEGFAAATHGGAVAILDSNAVIKTIFRGHNERVWTVAEIGDLGWCASAGGDGFVRVWDIAAAVQKGIVEFDSMPIAVAYVQPIRKLVVSLSNGSIAWLHIDLRNENVLTQWTNLT